jgi:hypothetical protein
VLMLVEVLSSAAVIGQFKKESRVSSFSLGSCLISPMPLNDAKFSKN